MNLVEELGRDERLSSSTRLVGAAILQQIDPLTGRVRVTATRWHAGSCSRNGKEGNECAHQSQLYP